MTCSFPPPGALFVIHHLQVKMFTSSVYEPSPNANELFIPLERPVPICGDVMIEFYNKAKMMKKVRSYPCVSYITLQQQTHYPSSSTVESLPTENSFVACLYVVPLVFDEICLYLKDIFNFRNMFFFYLFLFLIIEIFLNLHPVLSLLLFSNQF